MAIGGSGVSVTKPKLGHATRQIHKEYPHGRFWDGALWQKERFLGKGGFGSVFLFERTKSFKEQHQSHLPSALVLKTALLKEASTLKKEKQILCYLQSCPYIISCYGDKETEDVEGTEFYALFPEFCSGGSLWDRINNSVNGLPESEVRAYTRDVVRGLCYLHSNRIIHCDIKPGNILLAPASDGGFVAKLADFGLAKNLNIEQSENSGLRGTYRYMSPELVKDGLLTYSADIWALGCVVVEMMTARRIWGSRFANKYDMLNHIGCSYEVPEFPRNISEDGRDFLSKCFIRPSSHRWSAAQLLKHPFLC